MVGQTETNLNGFDAAIGSTMVATMRRLPVGAIGGCVAVAALASSAHAESQKLSDLVAQAIAKNPTIAAAQQKVAEQGSHLSEVEAHKKLQLTLSGTLSGSTGQVAQPSSMQSFATAEAALNAPIPNVARANAEVAQAIAMLEAARAQYRRAVLDIEYRTTTAGYEVLKARDLESIARENLTQASRQEADTKTRIAHGDLPPADLLKAQVPVAQAKAALSRAMSELRAARQVLNDLVQRPLNSEVDLEQPTAAVAAPTLDSKTLADAVAANPDVAEAVANVHAAESAERIARRGKDPDWALQLSHTRTGDPTAYGYLSTLALTVSLPISDGGINREQVRQAHLQADQAKTALKLADQHVRLDIEQASLDVEADQANVVATSQTSDIARQSLEKARQSYAAGLTTTRDVLDAQLILSQALIDANTSRYELAIAGARLRQLLGGNLK